MTEILLAIAMLLLLGLLAAVVALLRRPAGQVDMAPMIGRLEALERGQDRAERSVREDLAKARDENQAAARSLREEVAGNINNFREGVTQQITALSKVQHDRLEAFQKQLTTLTQSTDLKLDGVRSGLSQSLTQFAEAFTAQLKNLTESNEKRLDALREVVDARLKSVQEDSAKKLDEMRATVDEKLQGTLDKRLGESFKLVSERLEQVHKGLGEMQTLATGVGDLKKVLTNVKTRGTWGEVQLENLLEQFLSPEQFGKNVAIDPGGGERVEFAIKLPGKAGLGEQPVWLPIDAKFPIEDYQRLVDAHERADTEAIEAASKALEIRVRGCAKDICDKYIHPPHSTAFAYLYLPIEGLYAEVTRRVGLAEALRREYRVEIAGPHTLPAMLSSLQMGFHTLAIQKRSSEVWDLLAAVKSEFGKYGDVLSKVQKKLQEATNTIDQAQTRTRMINRRLKNVEESPTEDAQPLLPDIVGAIGEEEPA